MCGIVGIVGTGLVNQRLYDALTVLQHRGQDAAGIVTSSEGELCVRKGSGLVRDVFQQHHMLELRGNVGIAHVRYPTAGCEGVAEAQPFYVNAPYGICLGHNGNLTNAAELAEVLTREDRRHLNTSSDSEVLLNVFASELQRVGTPRVTPADIFAALTAVYRRCRGGYAAVAMLIGHGIVGFRDPNGIRPLVLGTRDTPKGVEWMLASESVALTGLGFRFVRDVGPGEAVFIDEQGRLHSQQLAVAARHTPCIFEYVYFARPDSIIDNVSVYRARMRMGEKLAERIRRERPDHDIEVVIPIPDTSRTAALQVAQILGLKYREGFNKNRYIGRTFIMPGQEQRERSVRRKLNAIDFEFRGKVVLLVDDSIVRGTTSAQIIELAREAGARKVYFASAAPPVRYPNVYGIDMPAADELVANGRSVAEVAKAIGADWLVYQTLEDLVQACQHDIAKITEFDTSCFSGEYVTGDVTPEYLERLRLERSDAAKTHRRNGERSGLKVVRGG
ncbi:MAG TPA: amidophosphoribosyltransferase [Steroidobacteraceae bacterium]|nr:amidophosphoribosyltransferase [Steroidobacteraceae bacterium]HQX46793.1 amidophosphoribosyltransferase [Steroidobacteraceae bacterium]HQX77477.1 amidophosphoribosyltransferase [Steroidobacteraceae bacterium]HQZ79326.1 amidophosphoribosyltransferase [Steroidobacteraceae bacterium]